MSRYGELRILGKCISCQNTNDTPEFGRCSKCREKQRKWAEENKHWYEAHGICVRCHRNDATPHRKMCPECAAYFANREANKKPTAEAKAKKRLKDMERYQQRKQAGLCTRCGKPRGHSKSSICCTECYLKMQRGKHKAYWAKADIPRKHRPDNGLCFICGKPYDPNGYKVCDKCREIERQGALRADNTKQKALHKEVMKRVFIKQTAERKRGELDERTDNNI